MSGFRCEVNDNCALLGYYAACSGNSLPTFRDNLSVPNSMVKNPRRRILDPWRWDQQTVRTLRQGTTTTRCV